MVKLIKGNVFESNADIIAHGCNTMGGFGSGVAGQMAKIYPEVRQAYMSKYEKDGLWDRFNSSQQIMAR